jgi:GTPase SAR1 family protein
MQRIYYKDAVAAVLVYDITRKVSFEELEKYWKRELADNAPNIKIKVVAANKSDMNEFEEVSPEMGKAYAADINGSFIQTSAKDGSGIEVFILL